MEVRPHGMVAGGDAIARDDDGRVVFVEGALPGERVAVDVTDENRDYRRAVVRQVLEPSPDRIAPPCPGVAAGCGGCQWQHIALPAQRALKRQIVEEALRRIAHVEAPDLRPVVELSADGYRTTVRAGVIDGRAGYRRRKGHNVLPVDSCLVAHPLVEDLLVNGRYGAADEVVLRCGARTGERMAAPHPRHAAIDVPADVPADVRPDHVHEEVAGRRWRISARSFFQARPDGADTLVDLVVEAAAGIEPRRAVDLYSGVGLFAGALADRGWSVTAVESSRHAVTDANANLRNDDVTVVRADVARWKPRTADLVVADPSRHGLAKDGVAKVAAAKARRVVLVSCDAAAFGRDVALLRAADYQLTSVTPVDLFPHTFHVEVVSVLDR